MEKIPLPLPVMGMVIEITFEILFIFGQEKHEKN